MNDKEVILRLCKQRQREAIGEKFVNASIDDLDIDLKLSLNSWMDSEEPRVLLYQGSVGCGKTHFCSAAIREISKKGKSFVYLKESKFLIEMERLYRKNHDQLTNAHIGRLIKTDEGLFGEKTDFFLYEDLATSYEALDRLRYILQLQWLMSLNKISILITTDKTVDQLHEKLGLSFVMQIWHNNVYRIDRLQDKSRR